MWIGSFSLPRGEQRHRGENASEEALHVAGAAAIELAVARASSVNGSLDQAWPSTGTQSLWPESPMPPSPCGPDGREQARLRPVGRGRQRRGDAVACESVAHEIDQLRDSTWRSSCRRRPAWPAAPALPMKKPARALLYVARTCSLSVLRSCAYLEASCDIGIAWPHSGRPACGDDHHPCHRRAAHGGANAIVAACRRSRRWARFR